MKGNEAIAVIGVLFLLIGLSRWYSENYGERTGGSSANIQEPQTKEDPLASVSPGMALLKQLISFRMTSCTVLSTVTRTECAGYSEAMEQLEHLSKYAIGHGKQPENAYLFHLIEEDAEQLKEQAIGLFRSMDECAKVEKIFRDADHATKSCRNWNTSFYYLLGETLRR